MSFTVGVVPTVAGVEPSIAQINWIASVVDAHPAWSIMDTYTVSTVKYIALRCEKGFSGLPKDFYVILRGVNNSSSYLLWMIAEDYDPATHMVRRMPLMLDATTPRTLTADGTISGDTWTLISANGLASPALNFAWAYPTSSSNSVGGQELAISVQNDCIILLARGRSPVFIGKFTSAVINPATNDPMPIVQFYDTIASTGGSINGDYTTRHPFKGGQSLPHPGWVYSLSNSTFFPLEITNGPYVGRTDGGSGDLFQNSLTPLYVPVLYQASQYNTASNPRTHGLRRGTVPQLRYSQLPVAAGGYLDTMVEGGTTWVFLGNGYWVDQAA